MWICYSCISVWISLFSVIFSEYLCRICVLKHIRDTSNFNDDFWSIKYDFQLILFVSFIKSRSFAIHSSAKSCMLKGQKIKVFKPMHSSRLICKIHNQFNVETVDFRETQTIWAANFSFDVCQKKTQNTENSVNLWKWRQFQHKVSKNLALITISSRIGLGIDHPV